MTVEGFTENTNNETNEYTYIVSNLMYYFFRPKRHSVKRSSFFAVWNYVIVFILLCLIF